MPPVATSRPVGDVTVMALAPKTPRPTAKPAAKLGKPGANLWRTILREYEIDDAAGLEMLALACEQLVRAQECREQIDRDGLMFRTKHGPKDHPLLKGGTTWRLRRTT